jgi:hypothetical protein|tara:strand:- start:35 stop:151 length:117 start_codon:yes stop_codon:yes gene_type:complete
MEISERTIVERELKNLIEITLKLEYELGLSVSSSKDFQ